MIKNLCLLAIALALPFACLGQEFRGKISGVVADPTGLPVAGAKITVTETNTQTRVLAESDASGHYNAPFLLPGVGAQGATAADCAPAFPGLALVSASRSVIFADDPAAAAERLAREVWDVAQAA